MSRTLGRGCGGEGWRFGSVIELSNTLISYSSNWTGT
jgi:hypothetical protein